MKGGTYRNPRILRSPKQEREESCGKEPDSEAEASTEVANGCGWTVRVRVRVEEGYRGELSG